VQDLLEGLDLTGGVWRRFRSHGKRDYRQPHDQDGRQCFMPYRSAHGYSFNPGTQQKQALDTPSFIQDGQCGKR